MEKKLVSVIIPVYNEGEKIFDNVSEINQYLDTKLYDFEIVLVDDGSKDNTWREITRLSDNFDNVRGLRLSRNFGKEAALCAGIENVNPDACIIMDSDLQHPPEIIPEMLKLWAVDGFDVVEGVKIARGRERFINKICALSFYKVLHMMSGIDLDRASDFKLLDAKVIEALKTMGERNTFFRGMSAWTGFNRASIPFEVKERNSGRSKWSAFKLMKLAINAITSFSSMPLYIVTFLGALFLAGSFILGLQTLYMKFRNIAVSGFTTVILLLLIIGSTLMISLGIIGTYIAKIYEEVKGRPRYLVSEKTDKFQALDAGNYAREENLLK